MGVDVILERTPFLGNRHLTFDEMWPTCLHGRLETGMKFLRGDSAAGGNPEASGDADPVKRRVSTPE
jgi:hypothetical protein